jgi:hypothetical protein
VLIDGGDCYFEQDRHLLLGQPDVLSLDPDFNAAFPSLLREDQEFGSAIADPFEIAGGHGMLGFEKARTSPLSAI